MQKKIKLVITILIVGISIPFLIFPFQNNSETTYLEKLSDRKNTYDIKVRDMPIDDPHVKKIFSECGIEQHCTVEGLWDLAKLEDKQTALASTKEILAIYEEIGFYCHENGHHLGMFVYGLTGNLSEALSSVERRCGGSVYHGIIENYFMTALLLKNQKIEDLKITNICDEISGSDLTRDECLHGIGHGLSKSYNHDRSLAFNRCDEFEDAKSCYNGVAMAYSLDYFEDNKESLNGEDIIETCNSLDEKYQFTCYIYQAQNIVISKKFSTKASLALCDTIDDQDSIKHCYYGVGAHIFIGEENSEGLVSECLTGNPNYQTYCLSGSESAILDEWGTDKGFEFCKIIPEKSKFDCYTLIGDWIRLDSSLDLKKTCSSAENAKYYEICLTPKSKRIECNVEIIKNGKNITDSGSCGIDLG